MSRATNPPPPVKLLVTERSPAAGMADWLAADEAPSAFTIDQDCRLRSVTEERAQVAYIRNLDGEQIRQHLAQGKLPIQLALTFDDRVSFVLTDKLEVKRIDFLDVVKDQLDGQADDARAHFDASFTLMAAELGRLFGALVGALGGELVRDH